MSGRLYPPKEQRTAKGIRTLDPELGKLARAPVNPATWRKHGELYEQGEPHEQLSRISSAGLMQGEWRPPGAVTIGA